MSLSTASWRALIVFDVQDIVERVPMPHFLVESLHCLPAYNIMTLIYVSIHLSDMVNSYNLIGCPRIK